MRSAHSPLDRRFENAGAILGTSYSGEEGCITVINPDHLLQQSFEAMTRNAGLETRQAGNERGKILVVDDSITVRELERRLLLQAGFDCDIAIDGVDGCEKAMSGNYAMIITDIDMPRMNGFELIENVRKDARFREVPILVVSYKEREADRSRSMLLGAQGFLSKGSFRDDTFIQTVAQYVTRGKS